MLEISLKVVSEFFIDFSNQILSSKLNGTVDYKNLS